MRPAPEFHLWNEPHEDLAELLRAAHVRTPGQVAARLLLSFGCLDDVLNARLRHLVRAGGWASAWALKRLPRSVRNRLIAAQSARPLLGDLGGLRRFLHEYADCLHDEVLAIYVDSRLRLVQVKNAPSAMVAGETIDIAALIAAGHRIGAAGFYVVRTPGDRTWIETLRPLPGRTLVRATEVPLMQQLLLPSGHFGFVEQLQRAD